MKISCNSLADTQSLAQKISSSLHPPQTIVFKGPLGAGKTTLIQFLVKALGSQDQVKSPSYTIARQYHLPNNRLVVHLDLYRLTDSSQLKGLSIDEYTSDPDIFLFIEWPEKLLESLPANAISITLEPLGESSRHITIDNLAINF